MRLKKKKLTSTPEGVSLFLESVHFPTQARNLLLESDLTELAPGSNLRARIFISV